MWQFSQVIDGMTKACEELDVPITGGNVSFYNETLGEGIYPTPVVGIVGILEDVHKAVRPDFRELGRSIVLLRAGEPGDVTDAESEFGSSDYAKEILGCVWGYPPEIDLEKEAALQKVLFEMAQAALEAVPELDRVRLVMPNKHYLLVNLAPFDLENANEVFVPTDEPHGQIEATVSRT